MQNPPPTQQGYGYNNQYGAPSNAPLATPPGGGPKDKAAIGLDANLASALGYPIGIIALIQLFIEKGNRFARFHALQSLLLHVAWIVIFIVVGIVFGILTAINSYLGILGGLIFLLILLAYIGCLLFCAYKAYQGQTFKMPAIGDMAANFANKV